MTIEFLPGVWVGKKTLTQNTNFIQSKNISTFINLSKDLNFLDKSYEYQDSIQKNIKRYETLKLVNYMEEITSYIYKKIINNQTILIFCDDGISKCQYILLAYLIKYAYIDLNIGMNIIKTKIINSFNDKFKYQESFDIFIKKLQK